jgi:hypothetical protein
VLTIPLNQIPRSLDGGLTGLGVVNHLSMLQLPPFSAEATEGRRRAITFMKGHQ